MATPHKGPSGEQKELNCRSFSDFLQGTVVLLPLFTVSRPQSCFSSPGLTSYPEGNEIFFSVTLITVPVAGLKSGELWSTRRLSAVTLITVPVAGLKSGGQWSTRRRTAVPRAMLSSRSSSSSSPLSPLSSQHSRKEKNLSSFY